MLFVGGILLMNIMTPFNGDDYRYNYVWNSNPYAEIENFSDVIESNITHYQVMNGRFIPHVLEQSFMGIIGKSIFNIFNTFVIFLLVYLLTKVLSEKYEISRLSAYLLSILGFLWAFASMSVTQLWMDGAFNYLWPMTGLMAVLVAISNPNSSSLVSLKNILLILLALLSASCHEGLGIPAFMTVVLYMILNRKEINRIIVAVAIAICIGVLFVSLAPGAINRLNSVETVLSGSLLDMILPRVRGTLSAIKTLWIVWLSLIYYFILLIKNRKRFVEQIRSVWGCLWLCSFAFLFALGYGAERVAYPLSIASFIIVVDGIRTIVNNTKIITLLVIVVIISLIYGIYVNSEHMIWHNRLCDAIEKAEDSAVLHINEHDRESKLIFKDHWENQIPQRNLYFKKNQICLLNDSQWCVYNECPDSYRVISFCENSFIGQMNDGSLFICLPIDMSYKNIILNYFEIRTNGITGFARKIFNEVGIKKEILFAYYDVVNNQGKRYIFFPNPGRILSIQILRNNNDSLIFQLGE